MVLVFDDPEVEFFVRRSGLTQKSRVLYELDFFIFIFYIQLESLTNSKDMEPDNAELLI